MIYNLTPTMASPRQRGLGIVDIGPEYRTEIARLLHFKSTPDRREVALRVNRLVGIAVELGTERVLITGPEFLTDDLSDALKQRGIEALRFQPT